MFRGLSRTVYTVCKRVSKVKTYATTSMFALASDRPQHTSEDVWLAATRWADASPDDANANTVDKATGSPESDVATANGGGGDALETANDRAGSPGVTTETFDDFQSFLLPIPDDHRHCMAMVVGDRQQKTSSVMSLLTSDMHTGDSKASPCSPPDAFICPISFQVNNSASSLGEHERRKRVRVTGLSVQIAVTHFADPHGHVVRVCVCVCVCVSS